MNERDYRGGTPVTGVPILGEEARGMRNAEQQLAYLTGSLEEYKKNTPTMEQLRNEVSGAANRLSVAIKSVEDKAATKTDLERIEPPSFWKLVGLAAAAVATIVGFVWNMSGRVQDMTFQNELLRRDLSALTETVKRLEAAGVSTAGKVDQLLIARAHQP